MNDIYKEATQPIEAHVADLSAQMTQPEKLGQATRTRLGQLALALLMGGVLSTRASELLDLSGEWALRLDSQDVGVAQKWSETVHFRSCKHSRLQ